MEQPKKTVALKQCPLCASTDFTSFLSVKDYFLTQENFDLVKCTACDFVFTNPIPALEDLHKYYESPDYLSHNVKRFNLTGVVYDFLRNLNLNGKYKLISKFKKKGSVLDIGQGTGEFLHYMQGKGWTVKGIEPNADARQFAKEKYHLDVEDESEVSNLPEHSFDLITMWHVLEHVPDLDGRMVQLRSLVKKDGYIIIAVPNLDSPDSRKYKEKWAALDVPRHLYHFTKETMTKLLNKYQFDVTGIYPLKLDAYYVSMLSEKYLGNSFPYPAAFQNGLHSNRKARKENEYSSMIFVAKPN